MPMAVCLLAAQLEVACSRSGSHDVHIASLECCAFIISEGHPVYLCYPSSGPLGDGGLCNGKCCNGTCQYDEQTTSYYCCASL